MQQTEHELLLNARARTLLEVAEAEGDTEIGVAALARCRQLQSVSLMLQLGRKFMLLRSLGVPTEAK